LLLRLILTDERTLGKAAVPTESSQFRKLERTIANRAKKPNPKSYTSQLLDGGVPKIGAKIVEEAAEVVEAAGEAGRTGVEHFVREVGDLMYHLMVMLRHKNCTLDDVESELARRFGVSGLEEKAARKKPGAEKAETKSARKRSAKKVATTVAAPLKRARRKSRL
jgi:phosphoribosyl-ATP pyrophosphohydrolase